MSTLLHYIFKFKQALLAAFISLSVISCGGGSAIATAGISGTGIVFGMITGFGSVYVNGVRFDTSSSSFNVDDDSTASQDDLRVGMLVQIEIEGEISPDGLSATAKSIIYENEVEGPVSSVDNITDAPNVIITILGRNITVTPDTRFDNDDNTLDIATLAVDDMLEVSGYTTATGIVATHIEQQIGGFTPNVTEVEIKGTIDTGSLTANSFTIDGLSIQYDSGTILEDIPSGSLSEGLFVEVKGTLNGAGNLLSATKIEGEDDSLGDEDNEVDLAGIIYGYDGVAQTFQLQGITVDFSQAPELEPANLVLADDLRVKVEGSIVNGILIADEIELEGRKIEVEATITDISVNPLDLEDRTLSFSLFGGTDNISARVNQQTEMEDDVFSTVSFNPSDLLIGDYVRLEAFDDGSGVINAVELERRDVGRFKLKGPIDGFDEGLRTLTLFGETFSLPLSVEYENANDILIDAAIFYGALSTGTLVELEDDEPDGVIDSAGLED